MKLLKIKTERLVLDFQPPENCEVLNYEVHLNKNRDKMIVDVYVKERRPVENVTIKVIPVRYEARV